MSFLDFFKRDEEKRAESEVSVTPATDTVLARALFREGGKISRDVAMSIPCLAGAVNILSGVCASVPFKLYSFDSDGKLCEEDDYRVALFNGDTGDLMNGYNTKKAFVRDYILDGNGYIFLNRRGNRVESLHYVRCGSVGVQQNEDEIFRKAIYNVNGSVFMPSDFITIARNSEDGVTGFGITDESRLVLSLIENMIKMINTNIKSGGAKRGFLKSSKPLSEPQIKKLKEDYVKLYNDNASMLILNSGLEFEDVDESSTELQLKEFYNDLSSDIGEILGIPLGILNGTAKKEEYKNWFKTSISPLLCEIAASLNHTFLTESEKGRYFWRADTSEIESGDLKETYEAFKIGVDSNIIQVDEARKRLGYEPTGFNMFKFGLDSVFIDPKTKMVYTPNTNIAWSFDKKGVELGGEKRVGSGVLSDGSSSKAQAPNE